MQRRNFVFASSGALIAPSVALPLRTLGLTAPQLVAGGSTLVLCALPRTARADPFTFGIFALVAVVAAIAGWDKQRTDNLAQSGNWSSGQGVGEGHPADVHSQAASTVQLKPEARFLEQQTDVAVDARSGKVELYAPGNQVGNFRRDVNPVEAALLGLTPFPQSDRLEPTATAREHLERAWVAMGGELAPKGVAYQRQFSDRSGTNIVRVSNGVSREGRDALIVYRVLKT